MEDIEKNETTQTDAAKQKAAIAKDRNTGKSGAEAVKAVAESAATPQPPDPPRSAQRTSHEAEIVRHQPPAEGTIREFADHIDRERQMFKDWVRKEIGLLVQGKSHDERAAENP